MQKIGCHIGPGGKNVLKGLAQAQALDASAYQLFAGGRISREVHYPSPEDAERFRAEAAGLFGSVHAPYVINPSSPPESELGKVSRECLAEVLRWADQLAIDVVVVHPGSAKENNPAQARQWCAEACAAALAAAPGKTKLLLENSAGDARGRLVGRALDELVEIAEHCGNPERLGICIDTTHAWAAGYELAEIAALPGRYPQIELVHFNAPAEGTFCGCLRDRHGVFAETALSEDELRPLARALATHCPLVMETRAPTDIETLRAWLR